MNSSLLSKAKSRVDHGIGFLTDYGLHDRDRWIGAIECFQAALKIANYGKNGCPHESHYETCGNCKIHKCGVCGELFERDIPERVVK